MTFAIESGMAIQAAAGDDARIYNARAHAAQHRIPDAERAYREILKTDPDTPEALNFVAMCALSRGDFASAEADLLHAANVNPTEPEIWKNVGIVQLAQHRGADALDSFDRALGMEPMHFASRLHRGAALEELGRVDAATATYFGALATAQSRGKWRNDLSTPPALRPVVRHAIEFVDRHRKRIFMEVLQPLRDRYGEGSLARIEQGLEIYLEERPADYPDARQFCKFLYVPGLAHDLYYPRERFPWYDRLELAYAAIRTEMLAVLGERTGIEPFFGTNDNQVLNEQQLLEGANGKAEWNSFFFHRHGEEYAENQQRCPQTMAALAAAPLVFIRDHAPEALFSFLAPHSHIMKHHGVTNTRLVTHLPLVTPPECALSVGGVDHAWQQGRCVTFDDTFEHESWNRSDELRVNLMMDVWHPDLSEAERAAVTLLVEGIGDFRQAAKVDPPPAS